MMKLKQQDTRDCLENLLDYANAPIIVWDPEFRITRFNHAFEHLSGRNENEVLGETLDILFPDDRRKEAMANIHRTMAGERWRAVEIPILHKDGTVRIALWNSATLYAKNGTTVIATMAQGQDITERKQTEQRLAHLNLVLRAIRNVNQLITREKDRDKLLQSICDTLIETRGYHHAWIAFFDESEELVSTAEAGLSEVFISLTERQEHGDMIECAKMALAQPEVVIIDEPALICSDCPLRKEYNGRKAVTVRLEYNTKVYGLLSVSVPAPLASSRDEQTLFKEIAGDIAFALHDIKLEEERTSIENNRLKLLDELERSNSELKDFAYIVSHDLKAPLRAITSLAEWISADYCDKLDEDGKEQLSLLLNRTRRMHNLIEGILEYSRIGRLKEKKDEVDLMALVREVITMIDPPENIEIEIVDTLPVIICEKTRIGQVFQNLLSNAMQYMDKPKGKITIQCTKDQKYWKFTVMDNGPGIEKRYFEKIFQIFQTLKPRDEVESTGVGLTIVKKIVEMHGGTIGVESTVGEGSTFFFTIPKEKKK